MRTLVTFSTAAALLLAAGAAARAGQPEKKKWQGGSPTQGQVLYQRYCSVCHGTMGRGDGTLAADLRVRPADLTGLAKRNDGKFPTEKVVEMVDGRKRAAGHGSPDMPAWGDVFQKNSGKEEEVKQRITDLVEYLRTIQD